MSTVCGPTFDIRVSLPSRPVAATRTRLGNANDAGYSGAASMSRPPLPAAHTTSTPASLAARTASCRYAPGSLPASASSTMSAPCATA
jgi:hypothetical protein